MTTMKDEEIRIAIAEACGYERQVRSSMWWHRGLGKYFAPEELPDYLNDLNAMHEAEKVLNDVELIRMLKILVGGHLGGAYGTGFGMDDVRKISRATAAQRAEAFLRTLNLWRDDPCEPSE